MHNLFISVPSHNKLIHYDFVKSLFNLEKNLDNYPNIKSYNLFFHSGSHINRVRNEIVHEFLKSKCDLLLMLDCDLSNFEDIIPKLILSNYPVVGGCYRIKKEIEDYNVNFRYGVNETLHLVDKFGISEVKHIGTGCLLIQRKVFEHIIENNPDIKYKNGNNENVYNFFHSYVDDNKKYLSEDYGFCELAYKNGFKIYGDLESSLNHIGQREYSGSLIVKLNSLIQKFSFKD